MEALGIDLKNIIIQMASFGIFYFLFTRFLLAPILKILDERKKKIAVGIENAEKAREELEKIEDQKSELKKKTKTEEKKILDAARVKADEMKDEILYEAKMKSQKIIQAAGESAKNIEMQVIKQAQENQLKIVEKIVEKILDNKINDIDVKAKYQQVMNYTLRN